MATLTYDASGNQIQTINNTTFIPNGEQGVIAPLTNAAVNPNVYPQGAPNVPAIKGAGITTTAFQVNNTVAGVIVSVCTNPAIILF